MILCSYFCNLVKTSLAITLVSEILIEDAFVLTGITNCAAHC